MSSDVRVCFLGDSFVAGVGDPQCLGWAGRLAALAHRRGTPLTAYNLGIRRDTSADVLARWRAECTPRLPAGCDARLVLSFGVNDTVQGLPAAGSTGRLRTLLTDAAAWPRLVVGPPPVDDEPVNRALAALDESFAEACRDLRVPYVSTLPALVRDPVWMREVRAGDGAHPGAAGYEALTRLVAPAWVRWLDA
ncbi:GDSL-type esterase/lipase family protein [Dactylosporangium sp. CA-052675]|uniref:GDSL-type esterase/lipase family protein n=1 Tax=Dactylosporangium sp. CA-052675 TaxID=3239927 RepID=UPI003D8ACE5E